MIHYIQTSLNPYKNITACGASAETIENVVNFVELVLKSYLFSIKLFSESFHANISLRFAKERPDLVTAPPSNVNIPIDDDSEEDSDDRYAQNNALVFFI